MNRLASLSAFFPAHNEAENVERMVESLDAICQKITQEYEIILVDDGSVDGTQTIAARLQKQYSRFRIVSHEGNLGYGAAIRTGLSESRMDYVFFTDGDLQFDVLELEKFLADLPEFAVVIGYRSPRRDPWMRRLFGWGWNTLMRILFGLHVRDVDCAFKLFQRSALEGIDLVSQGAMLSAELLIKLKQKGIRLREVPVTHFPRRAGAQSGANPRVILRALKELGRLYPILKK